MRIDVAHPAVIPNYEPRVDSLTMSVESYGPTRPDPLTRFMAACQGAGIASIACPTVGSASILAVSAVTHWTPGELVVGNENLLLLLFVCAIAVGFIAGSYWPVVDGLPQKREHELYWVRKRFTMCLFGGLGCYGVFSLMFVVTVTDLLQNMVGLGAAILVCTYLYAYSADRRGVR
ncbi:hypothetical protein [Haloferax sp. Atlit-4N]|uniref:hypothetical protein n=1 Tax=Haloferax sp. Atlit-4N TaxID=2077206 RepID=UPI001F3A6CAF|nr:hypothetical protein [Haloferax sp. Atlit-4N]